MPSPDTETSLVEYCEELAADANEGHVSALAIVYTNDKGELRTNLFEAESSGELLLILGGLAIVQSQALDFVRADETEAEPEEEEGEEGEGGESEPAQAEAEK